MSRQLLYKVTCCCFILLLWACRIWRGLPIFLGSPEVCYGSAFQKLYPLHANRPAVCLCYLMGILNHTYFIHLWHRFASGPQYEEIDEFDDFEDEFDPYGDDSDFEDSNSKRKKAKKKESTPVHTKGSRRSTRGGGHDEEQKPFQCERKLLIGQDQKR